MTPKGVYCPNCRGWRLLYVVRVYRPRAGVTIRYRRCSACETRFKTEERAVVPPPTK